MPAENDIIRTDELKAEPARADEIVEPRHAAAPAKPAIADPEEHEEAGYGYGV